MRGGIANPAERALGIARASSALHSFAQDLDNLGGASAIEARLDNKGYASTIPNKFGFVFGLHFVSLRSVCTRFG